MVVMPCREAIEPRVCQAAWIRFVPFLSAGTKEQKGTSAEGGAGGGSRGGGLLGRGRKAGLGWEIMEASETRRPSVKEMREEEKPRFGSGSVTRGGEIKGPSFPAASLGV